MSHANRWGDMYSPRTTYCPCGARIAGPELRERRDLLERGILAHPETRDDGEHDDQGEVFHRLQHCRNSCGARVSQVWCVRKWITLWPSLPPATRTPLLTTTSWLRPLYIGYTAMAAAFSPYTSWNVAILG